MTVKTLKSPFSPSNIFEQIRKGFTLQPETLEYLAGETLALVTNLPALRSISNLSFLDSIQHPKKTLIKRAGHLSPQAILVSERIKRLCHLPYRRRDGRRSPCGGILKNYLACSPYTPPEAEMKRVLSKGNVFCLIQADGLTEMHQQRYLHEILLETEGYLLRDGLKIVMSFSAGPCRICNECAGASGLECYAPEKRRFSLESCGIDVDLAMTSMAFSTGDEAWKIKWIKDFRLRHEEQVFFKSLIGILLSV